MVPSVSRVSITNVRKQKRIRIRHLVWLITRSILSQLSVDAFVKHPNYHYVPDYYGKTSYKYHDLLTLMPFAVLAKVVIESHNTTLYYDRLHTIYRCLENGYRLQKMQQLTSFNAAEVGVYKGGGSYFVASTMKALNFTNARLFAFDTFEGHSQLDLSEPHDPSHSAQSHRVFKDTSFEQVREYLSSFKNVHVFKGRFQERASEIADLNFHFVHLDMDIYEPTKYALNFFDDRLAPGGMILLDDYGFKTCPGVEEAVTEFLQSNPTYNALPLLTGQCLLVKYSNIPEEQ